MDEYSPYNPNDPNFLYPFAAYTPTNTVNITDQDVYQNTYTLDKYGITVQAVKDELFGIDTTDPNTGQEMPDSFYQTMIYLALDKAEKELDVTVIPRINDEQLDYNSSDWNSYQYMQFNYRPILTLDNISLIFMQQTVFSFPTDWARIYRLSGQVQIFPNLLLQATGNLDLNSMAFSSYPLLGVLPIENSNTAPQLIRVRYISGMLPQSTPGVQREWEIHPSFVRLVIKLAAMEIFQKFAKVILPPGIASFTTSIDDISQTINTIQSPKQLLCA